MRPKITLVNLLLIILGAALPLIGPSLENEAQFKDHSGNWHKLAADLNRINGTSVISSHSSGAYIGETHTINTQNVDLLKVWLLDINYNTQLVCSNRPDHSSKPPIGTVQNKQPYITFYSWRSSYFDTYQMILLEHDTIVTDFEPFSINGQDFLAVSLQSTKMYDLRRVPNTHRQPYDNQYYQHMSASPMSARQASVDSRIYRLDFADGELKWVVHQKLTTSHATDLLAFHIIYDERVGISENYLALLGELDDGAYGLNILKYVGDKFALISFELIPNAIQLSIDTYHPSSNMLLLVKLIDGSMISYSFDGLKRLQVHVYQPPEKQMPPLVQQLPPPIANQLSEYALKSNQTPTYSVPVIMMPNQQPTQLTQSPRSSQPSSQMEDLLNWCRTTIDAIIRDGFEQTRALFDRLPRVDQPKPIELFGDLEIHNDISISHLLSAPAFRESTTGGPMDELKHHLSIDSQLIFNELSAVTARIVDMRNFVEQILVNDGSNQEINARLEFDTIVLDCQQHYLAPGPKRIELCPRVGEIHANFLNGQNISVLPGQAVFSGRSMTIDHDVRFEHLVLRGDVQINGQLDGVRIQDIVFKSGSPSGPIIGHKRFKSLTSTSHITTEALNGLIVDRSTVLTTTGDQHIASPIIINNLTLDSPVHYPAMSRIDYFNGLNVSDYFNRLILTDSSNAIMVPIEIDRLIIKGPLNMIPGSSLSSVNIEDLAANVLMNHGDQVITAPIHVSDLVLPKGVDILVNGSLNGIYPFTRDNIIMNNQNVTIRNPVTFEDDIYAENVEVRESINGIPFARNVATGRFEPLIMYLSGDQEIAGQKLLHHVILAGPSFIEGNINGHLNLTELYRLSKHNGPYHFGNVHLDGLIEVKEDAPFNINGPINGVNISHLCQQALSQKMIEYNDLYFEHPITFKSLRCLSIDGVQNLSDAFLTTNTDQYMPGALILNNGFELKAPLNILNSFNNMSVVPLVGSLHRNFAAITSGRKEIFGDLYVDDLLVEQINDLSVKDIIHKYEDQYILNGSLMIRPQYITGSLQFEDLDIENYIEITGNMHASHINGINMSDLFYNTLSYEDPQTVYTPLIVNSLHIPNGNHLFTRNGINGINLTQVYNDAVLKDQEQIITGAKIFDNGVYFNKLFFEKTFDGVTDEDLRINWLLQDTEQVIQADIEFNNDLVIRKNLTISSGIINDININQLAQSILLTEPPSRSYRINGRNGSIRLMNVKVRELVVGGRIQGIDLSSEGVQDIKQNSPILLTGRKHFRNGFKVNGNFSHNLYDIERLCNLPPIQHAPFIMPPPIQPFPLLRPPLPQSLPPILPPPHQPLSPVGPPPMYPLLPNGPPPTIQSLSLIRAPQIQLQSPVRPPTQPFISYNATRVLELPNLKRDLISIKSIDFKLTADSSFGLDYDLVHSDMGVAFAATTFKKSTFLITEGLSIHTRQHFNSSLFQLTSVIENTKTPGIVHAKAQYLFVTDELASTRITIFSWNMTTSRYHPFQTLYTSSLPTDMKAHPIIEDRFCLFVAARRMNIFCQGHPGHYFMQRNQTFPVDNPHRVNIDQSLF